VIKGTSARFSGASGTLANSIETGSECILDPTEFRAITLNEYIVLAIKAIDVL
jgi:hypothetical protein